MRCRGLVCTGVTCAAMLAVPTSAAAALPGLLNNADVKHPFQVRPAQVSYTGDGTGILGGFGGGGKHHWGHMTWLTWTTHEATGTGALWGDDCEPNCAEGTFSPVPVKVRAFAPHDGHFTRLKLVYDRDGKAILDERGTRHYRSQYAPRGGYWEYFIVRHTAKPLSKATPIPAPVPAPAPAPAPVTTPATAPKTGPETGRIGEALSVDHGALVVTPTVRDPVAGLNEFETPMPGARFIAVHLVLRNAGSTQIENDAEVDTSVIGSNSQAYTTAFDETPGCTDFDSGEYSLSPGGEETGCVLYELPEGVTAQEVRFGLELNVEAQWNA